MEEKSLNITNELIYLENMSEHDFKTKSREICKTIIIDQKMLEDGYLNKRKQYEEISGKMLEQIKKDNAKETEKLSFKALDSYLDLTKQEARREYNRRLLKIILG